jgi:hypothetical protein
VSIQSRRQFRRNISHGEMARIHNMNASAFVLSSQLLSTRLLSTRGPNWVRFCKSGTKVPTALCAPGVELSLVTRITLRRKGADGSAGGRCCKGRASRFEKGSERAIQPGSGLHPSDAMQGDA